MSHNNENKVPNLLLYLYNRREFWHSHLYPARMFIKVDFPAPEGPMIPISSRLQNLPDRHFSKALKPGNNKGGVDGNDHFNNKSGITSDEHFKNINKDKNNHLFLSFSF